MSHPTYSLRVEGNAPSDGSSYLDAVRQFADEILRRGTQLHTIIEDYRGFVGTTQREAGRSHEEYLLEALLLGVLWYARGREAEVAGERHEDFLRTVVEERRAGLPRRRDGSTAVLLRLGEPFQPSPQSPCLADLDRLLDWLLALGEYDDEVIRLQGWQDFLHAREASANAALEAIWDFALEFEVRARRSLSHFTPGVDRFVRRTLPMYGRREDTVQCSRPRIEYHFNMLGAEVLNRAWRRDFLACARHVVILPGCTRQKSHADCAARKTETDLRCAHCTPGCTVSKASRVAAKQKAETVVVLHGSDFGRFLRSPELSGGDVAIVGVACLPGLVGAGWRARAQGLPAQCVPLDFSGCGHWRVHDQPTRFDLQELARILRPDSCGASGMCDSAAA